ncbi:MAG: hypothetical protein NT004_03075 [Bacteroidetes bacterium]|nr:hypothetical protein [Bacteroidota bacterium]
MGGELVGKIRYKKAFIEQIPVPVPTELQEKQMNELVDKIIAQKQQGDNSDGNERRIDELVYKLFEITPDEQKIIEGNLS